MINLKKLSILTLVLFVISLGVYFNENKRNTDLAEGSDYIKGLDISTIQKINIKLHKEDNKKISLVKEGDRFLLESHKSFPAANDKVNDLIFRIANIQIKEKVKSNASEADKKKYELDEAQRLFTIEIFDNSDTKTVDISVGKQKKNQGNYLFRDGKKDIYLSNKVLTFNSSKKGFLSDKLLSINSDKVVELSLIDNGKITQVQKNEDGLFKLAESPDKELNKDGVNFFLGHLSELTMEDYYLPNDEEILSASFNRNIKVILKDQITYNISVGKSKDKYFLKTSASSNDSPKQVVVSKDDGADKLKDIENMVTAGQRVEQFNSNKARWIFEIKKDDYDNLMAKLKLF